MSRSLVLDACALIAFLNDEDGAEEVEKLLQEGERRPGSLLLHEVNLLEVYYGIYREESEAMARQVLRRIADLPIEVVRGLAEQVFFQAGKWKATYGVSLADSIALAEAKCRNVPLVTCDHHEFDKLDRAGELQFVWIR
jgi:PIN domain nuclease of toxin-antitoxin system